MVQLAKSLGLHYSTVSLALRNDSRIPEKTRSRIRKAAQTMGYVPDPMLRALSAYRKKTQSPVYRETLAWITFSRQRNEWRKSLDRRKVHGEAVQRATELGYRLEEFWWKESGISGKRASDILSCRGIRGLIIYPLDCTHGHLSLDWGLFSAVAIGYAMNQPKLHMVSYTHYRAVVTAIQQLRELGHQRLAWVGERLLDERVERLWMAGFNSEMAMTPAKWHVPSFPIDPSQKQPFLKWFKNCRPDAILTTNFHIIIKWLEEASFQIPKDVRIASVNLKENQPCAGMIEPAGQVGRVAVGLVTRMIQNGERGIPEYPCQVLIEGKWVNGKTVAPK